MRPVLARASRGPGRRSAGWASVSRVVVLVCGARPSGTQCAAVRFSAGTMPSKGLETDSCVSVCECMWACWKIVDRPRGKGCAQGKRRERGRSTAKTNGSTVPPRQYGIYIRYKMYLGLFEARVACAVPNLARPHRNACRCFWPHARACTLRVHRLSCVARQLQSYSAHRV